MPTVLLDSLLCYSKYAQTREYAFCFARYSNSHWKKILLWSLHFCSSMFGVLLFFIFKFRLIPRNLAKVHINIWNWNFFVEWTRDWNKNFCWEKFSSQLPKWNVIYSFSANCQLILCSGLWAKIYFLCTYLYTVNLIHTHTHNVLIHNGILKRNKNETKRHKREHFWIL